MLYLNQHVANFLMSGLSCHMEGCSLGLILHLKVWVNAINCLVGWGVEKNITITLYR